jgi:AraC-like DNA-binding protein
MQVNRGKFQATLAQIPIRNWSLQYVRFEAGASVCAGDAPRDNFAFVVPLHSAPQCRLLGQPVTLRTLGVYAPGSEHADATVAFSEEVVIVAPDDFAERLSQEGLALSRRGSHLYQGCHAGMTTLHDLLNRVPQALDGPEAQRSLSDALRCVLFDALRPEVESSQNGTTLGRPKLPRPIILRQISEILKERKNEPIYAGELADEVGISQPSLQRLFHEWFAMPPARYLSLKRLYLARRLLREAKGKTVTDIAGSLGFWHLSRFSKSYKAVFGELPSETLRSSGRF